MKKIYAHPASLNICRGRHEVESQELGSLGDDRIVPHGRNSDNAIVLDVIRDELLTIESHSATQDTYNPYLRLAGVTLDNDFIILVANSAVTQL